MSFDIKHKEFNKSLTDEDFLRIEFDKIDGKIVKFCLLYESLIDGKICTIMRIDNSHGSVPHRHVFHKNKKKIKILLNKNPHVAFNQSQKFIVSKFQKIKENYLFAS